MTENKFHHKDDRQDENRFMQNKKRTVQTFTRSVPFSFYKIAYTHPNALAAWAVANVTRMAIASGIRADRIVHFVLLVSL